MISVDVVTPLRQLLVNVEADSVTLPGEKGQLQIFPGHTELVTSLRTGELTLPHQGKTRRFAISFGFAEVRDNKVIVLAETCEESHEIDKERAKAAQQKAETALSGSLKEGQFKKYEYKLQRALIRQQIAGR